MVLWRPWFPIWIPWEYLIFTVFHDWRHDEALSLANRDWATSACFYTKYILVPTSYPSVVAY